MAMKTSRLSFPFFFLGFYLAWVLRATLLFSALDMTITNDGVRSIYTSLIKIALWVLPAVVYILRVDRKDPLEVMRINTKPNVRGLFLAAIVSVLYFVLIFTFEYLMNHRTLGALLEANPAQLMASFLSLLVSPFIEEFFFRGFVLTKLLETRTFWSANILQALLFTTIHFPLWIARNGVQAGQIMASLSIFMIGVLLGWITQRTNSIWLGVLVHGVNNFLVSFLG